MMRILWFAITWFVLPVCLRATGPQYSASGDLKFPADYREWIFLSSGLGMTYATPVPNRAQRFDNVFVNPEAYRSFLQTGAWPDKTVFVLEVRSGESHVSINQGGQTQGEVVGIEVEVKDSAAKSGLWTFYDFSKPDAKVSRPISKDANCYECHGKNTAVENTFVQFYPTLLPIARGKGTLKPEFQGR